MLDTICDVLKAAYDRNWISTRDGNASYRRKAERFLYVTPSGVRKYHLNSEMLIKLEIEQDGFTRVMDEYQSKIIGLQPTGELLLHIMLQTLIPDNRIVLHLHPTYIIAAMYAGYDLQELAKAFESGSNMSAAMNQFPTAVRMSEQVQRQLSPTSRNTIAQILNQYFNQ